MSSSSRSLEEDLQNDVHARPYPHTYANEEQSVGEEPRLVLPSSMDIEDAWEEVARREDELEEEPNAEEEPWAEEQPEAEEEPEAEMA